MTETVYSRAADALNRYGWVKKSFGDPGMGFCAVGAVSWACGIGMGISDELGYDPKVITFFNTHTAMRQHLGRHTESWNDAPERTLEDVLNLFQELHEKELAERGELA